MKTTLFFASLVICVLLSGCYETRQEFTLNPDGSGKVTLEAFFYLEKFSLVEDQTPDEKLKDAVRSLLEKSEGVESWQDVSFRLLDDGRGYFRGIAYFPNVAGLKFHNLGNTQVKLVKDKANSMKFEIGYERDEDKDVPDQKPPVALSDKELAKEVAKAKADYARELRPMLVALLTGMREDMLFHVPGQVKAGSNLQADANGDIHFSFAGEKVIAAMDRQFADDALLLREIKAGNEVAKDGLSSDVAFQEMVFGLRPPFEAVLSGPFHPLFDYHREAVAARTNYPAMLKALGMAASIPVLPPAEGDGFKELKIGGVRLIRFSDQKQGIRPFNYDAGYTLSLIGKFSAPVIGLEEGKVVTAIADNGTDLLPKDDWDRKIKFPKLSEDKTVAIFDIDLLLPADGIRGLKELSGTMTSFVANGFREVDLGIREFKPGIKGKEFNAVISSIGKSEWGEGQAMDVKLDIAKEAVKDIKIYNEAGTPVKISGSGVSWSETHATFTQICNPKFPNRGRIVVSVYEQPQKFTIPFRIENISLLGQPLP